jgi:hypothetical protein
MNEDVLFVERIKKNKGGGGGHVNDDNDIRNENGLVVCIFNVFIWVVYVLFGESLT